MSNYFSLYFIVEEYLKFLSCWKSSFFVDLCKNATLNTEWLLRSKLRILIMSSTLSISSPFLDKERQNVEKRFPFKLFLFPFYFLCIKFENRDECRVAHCTTFPFIPLSSTPTFNSSSPNKKKMIIQEVKRIHTHCFSLCAKVFTYMAHPFCILHVHKETGKVRESESEAESV